MTISIESLRDGDAEARLMLGRQAFGSTRTFDPDAPRFEAQQVVAAYEGDTLVGAMATMDFAMTWGGRSQPCGGLTGVVVSPEARRRGVARSMLRESFERMDGRGQAISALFPTTATLYRSMGYEVVSWYSRRAVPLETIPTAPADRLTWRRVGFDEPSLGDLVTTMSARHEGWFRTDPAFWASITRAWTKDTGTNRYAYVGARDGVDVAGVIYSYASSDRGMYEIETDIVAAADHEAEAAILGFLAGHGTTATQVQTALPRQILALHIPELHKTEHLSDWPWMLRIVDAPAAIAARGWPTAVTGRIELDVTDEARTGNAGSHVFEVADGVAQLVPGGAGTVSVTCQTLAQVFAGTDVRRLHAAGHLPGATSGDLDVLSAACVSDPTGSYFF